MNITSLHTHILEASAAPENDAGAVEPVVQGVQLHTHYLLPFIFQNYSEHY